MSQRSPGKQRSSKPASGEGRKSGGSDSKGSNSSGDDTSDSDSRDSDSGEQGHPEPRTFPAIALYVVLVGGVLLGLLFAGVISSFVGGSSDSGSGSDSSGSGATSKPTATASRQTGETQTGQNSGSMFAADSKESRDVRILGCGTDARGFASASVLITNRTQQRATYYVRVVFTTAVDDGIVSDDVASVKRLPPGRAAPLQAVRANKSAPGEQVDCMLGSVSRF